MTLQSGPSDLRTEPDMNRDIWLVLNKGAITEARTFPSLFLVAKKVQSPLDANRVDGAGCSQVRERRIPTRHAGCFPIDAPMCPS